MTLTQVLIDTRRLPPQATESVIATFQTSLPSVFISQTEAPALAEGNAWLLCNDVQLGGFMLACWCLTVEQAIQWLIAGELITRCAELRRRSDWAYLVLIGQPVATAEFDKTCVRPMNEGDGTFSGRNPGTAINIGWRALQGALTSIQEYGVSVVYAANDADLGPMLLWLAERDRAPKKLAPLREAIWLTPGEELLLTVPGIGPERLQALVAYGDQLGRNGNDPDNPPYTAIEMLCDLLDTQQDIPGIPKTVQEHARVALGLDKWDYPAPQPEFESIIKLEVRPKQPAGKAKKRRSTKQHPQAAETLVNS